MLKDEHKEQIAFLNSSTLLGFINICGNGPHAHMGSRNNKHGGLFEKQGWILQTCAKPLVRTTRKVFKTLFSQVFQQRTSGRTFPLSCFFSYFYWPSLNLRGLIFTRYIWIPASIVFYPSGITQIGCSMMPMEDLQCQAFGNLCDQPRYFNVISLVRCIKFNHVHVVTIGYVFLTWGSVIWTF